MLTYKETTVKDFITNYKNEDMTIEKLFYPFPLVTSSGKKIVLNEYDICDRYKEVLDEYKRSYTFDHEEYKKYMYNPKVLSYDLYDTTEYWHLLLRINELYSVSEFDLQTVNVLDNAFISTLNEIINLEKQYMDENAAEVSKILLDQTM